VPAVIAGDFNSDAIPGAGGPDNTPAAALIQAAGYLDTWTIAGSGPGPTWPLYLEDQFPPPFFAPAVPFERIDLIFSQGLSVISVEHVMEPGPTANQWPYFASDHAGVLAVFEF
jgi:endonuclease/exonuclease/phosphatase family metal-dependent hydrolase